MAGLDLPSSLRLPDQQGLEPGAWASAGLCCRVLPWGILEPSGLPCPPATHPVQGWPPAGCAGFSPKAGYHCPARPAHASGSQPARSLVHFPFCLKIIFSRCVFSSHEVCWLSFKLQAKAGPCNPATSIRVPVVGGPAGRAPSPSACPASSKPPLPWARSRWPGLGLPCGRCAHGLGELGSPSLEPPPDPSSAMETPAASADATDPSATPAATEEHAPQPGKWALVRSLNQAFKSFAVLPVRPGSQGGRGYCGLVPCLSFPVR